MKRILSVLLVAGLLVLAVPAAVRADHDPTQEVEQAQFPESGRGNIVNVINRIPISWGQFEFTGDIFHAVYKDIRGDTVEVVQVGDRVYFRTNNETRWRAGNVEAVELPTAAQDIAVTDDPENATSVRHIGDVEVEGVLTSHIQFWFNPASIHEDVRSATDNFFIAKNDRMVRKYQATIEATDPELGNLLLESIFVLREVNVPVIAAAPPSNLVDEVRAAAARDLNFPGASALPGVTHPAFARAIARMRGR